MEGLGVAASVIAVVELSAKVASLCLEYSKGVKNAKDDIARLRTEVVGLQSAAKSVDELLIGPSGERLKASQQLRNTVRESQAQLRTLHERLRPKTAREALTRLRLRALKWPFENSEVEKVIQDITRCTQAINLALQVDQTYVTQLTTHQHEGDEPILGLLFSISIRRPCSAASRMKLPWGLLSTPALKDRTRRVYRIPEPNFCNKYPHGLSTPKPRQCFGSTVWQAQGSLPYLGPSGETDRGNMSKFVSTIAADLTGRVPATARHVKKAFDDDPGILRRTMREQFNKLIWHPMLMLAPDPNRRAIVIIVDALDECKTEDDVKLMIHLFSRTRTLQSLRLKVFLTSRPELPIRLGFKAIEGNYRDLILHEIPETVVGRDISTFLEHELAKIRDEYNLSVPEDRQLGGDWPGRSNTQTLLEMAIPLFIVAATVCLFIADRRIGTPDTQLKKVLHRAGAGHLSQLCKTYMPVLDNLIADLLVKQQEEILLGFRNIVGSIIILASPLSTAALARMLDIPRNDVDGELDMLHSVLSVPPSPEEPVRLLHLSFRDFLLDSELRSENRFWVDEVQAHTQMAANCLRIMNEFLRADICDLRLSRMESSIIDSQKIDAYIPAEVQYACLNWVFHLQGARKRSGNCHEAYSFLKRHFLHWIEALSLMRRAPESIGMSRMLQALLRVSQCNDMQRQGYSLYSSPRVTTRCPNFSRMPYGFSKNLFQNELPDWIVIKPRAASNWDECIQTLEDHSSVNSVAFSHDSALVASASDDQTVRLWRANTGECTRELEGHSGQVSSVGHSGQVSSVAFSHDSALVVSGSLDKTVRLWRANEGECIQVLKGHREWVNSVAFSHDSALVASASDDQTVRLWRADADTYVPELEGHRSRVCSVAFSHDLALVASASDDQMVRLWRANTGECIQVLEGHRGRVNSVAFSYNSALVVSASADRTVRLWRTDTGTNMLELKGHTSSVASVAFSWDDSALVVSGSYDKTVRLWSADTGTCIHKLEGHSDWVGPVAFSHDSALVASGSHDKTVRLWCAKTGECIRELKGHNTWVRSVAFSRDSELVVSTSVDKAVRLWRADTGKCIRELDIAVASDRISFEPGNLLLITDVGAFTTERTSPISYATGCGFSIDYSWITWNGKKLLWLPVEYRPSCSSTRGSTVALGCDSGRVFVIGIST
ncbi:vegetative incompatibility protein HET-E-1 [Purpureocillium lilacinum]|uniref:Vegetative incompatibility protein HET-E-1 n=1 Tax=Purpureocillium lilacinum TaxID=33203 RepID=A0A179FAQ1_PURLI|nr:vegetative incompatibility protein HET-E-1 [Purpureocillium lilacinum]OAQ62508.1 vegetative incompatibility protein HET-E-1 [Purpureocillium lilacinum]